MSGLHNLKPERVVKAFERTGWKVERQTGNHAILSKEGYPNILSVPVHKGKPMKQGLMKASGLTEKEFLRLYR